MTPHDLTVSLNGGSERISCSISGLSGVADVKWYNPSGSEITSGQGSYTIIDGKSDYSTGSQTTFLEIGLPVLQAMMTIETYKCGVTSGVETTSPESLHEVVVTPFGMLNSTILIVLVDRTYFSTLYPYVRAGLWQAPSIRSRANYKKACLVPEI